MWSINTPVHWDRLEGASDIQASKTTLRGVTLARLPLATLPRVFIQPDSRHAQYLIGGGCADAAQRNSLAGSRDERAPPPLRLSAEARRRRKCYDGHVTPVRETWPTALVRSGSIVAYCLVSAATCESRETFGRR